MIRQILVRRTCIELHGYEMGDYPSLEWQFTIRDPVYFTSTTRCMWYDQENQILKIPRGYSIPRLEKYFGIEASMDYSSDNYRTIGPIKLKKAPRDNTQIEAIKFILAMDQYKQNEYKSQLSLNLNTGKGKTYCAVASMAYMGICPIIIANGKSVLTQWADFICQYTDILPEEICIIDGTPGIAKLYAIDPTRYKVFLSTHATLLSYASMSSWNAISTLFNYLGIGLKYYDEAHRNFENMFMIDAHSNTYRTLYITATMNRSSREEDQMFQIYFNGVPSIDLFNPEEDPHTTYVGMRYNSHPTPVDIERCMGGYGLKRATYANYVVDQPMFQNMLHIMVNKALAKPGKCLWYIGTNEAILKVRDWIYANYPELVGDVGVFTSIMPFNKKQEQLDRKIILTTTGSAGEFVDIPGLVETANIAEPFKSSVLARQTLGRTRAPDTIYKDFVDVAFNQTKKFYREKRPIFTKYAKECKEILLRDDVILAQVDKIQESRADAWWPIVWHERE